MQHGWRRWPLATGAAVTAACAWWVAGLRPFTWPPLVAVGLAGAAVVWFGTGHRRDIGRVDARGVVVWALLWAALAGWELGAYLQHPRADHPTLSSLANQLLDGRPARAVAFLVWLAIGTELARR